jgi:hypothetical protein
MAIDRNRDYEVGRGRPPHRTRFKKGQSGNPKGRPRGSKNLYTLLNKVLNERVVIIANGRRRKITRLHAFLLQSANRAASGDYRHIQLLMHTLPLMEERVEKTPPREPPKFTGTSREEYAREVLRILRECGGIRDSDDVEDATPDADSEPAPPLAPPALDPTS